MEHANHTLAALCEEALTVGDELMRQLQHAPTEASTLEVERLVDRRASELAAAQALIEGGAAVSEAGDQLDRLLEQQQVIEGEFVKRLQAMRTLSAQAQAVRGNLTGTQRFLSAIPGPRHVDERR